MMNTVQPSVRAVRFSARRAFSLIELVIVVVIIGIIAAIAIPKLSQGSAAAADSSVAQDLTTMRHALDLFQTEHQGIYPTGTSQQVSDQLLTYTDIGAANTAAAKDTGPGQIIYGPYLRSIPPIAVGANRGRNGIAVSNTSGVAPTADGTTGWLYNSVDGTVAPYTGSTTADSSGRLYATY